MHYVSAIYNDVIAITSVAGLTPGRWYQQPAGGEGKKEEEEEGQVFSEKVAPNNESNVVKMAAMNVIKATHAASLPETMVMPRLP